jgi:hypothetical protein
VASGRNFCTGAALDIDIGEGLAAFRERRVPSFAR